MPDPTDEINWNPLLSKIKQVTGFKCENYTTKFLKRRIGTRLFSLNIKSYREYIDYLSKNPLEKNLLDKELTIHVTNFFRNREAFDIFVAETLTEILNQKKESNKNSLKIWSAGCSSGEEPYTIAMILLELLQSRINDFQINILGTDLSFATIQKAKEGKYDPVQLKEAPSEYVEKYFEKKEDDHYYIKDEVKNLVKFETSDILSDTKPKFLDIIFCRNVVIYFNQEQKEKLYSDFYESLNNTGYLVLGMTESLIGSAKDKFNIFNNSFRIYKKEN